MRKKSNLLQKLELLYKEIQPKRTSGEKMRLQTDQEFQQNEIKKLNQKHNVEKHLQLNKKLENLKKHFLEVKNYTKLIEVVVEKKIRLEKNNKKGCR